MRKITGLRSHRGATQLGFLDVLTALIVLAVLIWASWMQFPIYNRAPGADATTPSRAASP